MDEKLFNRTFQHAKSYLDSLDARPVHASATREQLLALLDEQLPETGEEPAATVDRLAQAGEVGTTACSGPRYFGFVIGGSLPAAQAADWLTTTWDQNAGLYIISPLNSVAEEIASTWLLDLMGLPKSAAVGFVTGGMMANVSALAAARHALLHKAGWDVEANGLQGAPKLDIVVSEAAHITIFNALRLLGIGTATPKTIKVDNQGRMIAQDLARVLASCNGPTLVCAQAGNVNSGAFDPIEEIAHLAKQHNAWLHIDGAFGLWAAASPKYRNLLRGFEQADSWAVDGHKWLNVPYDCGFVIVAQASALRGSFSAAASYLAQSDNHREPHEYVPELSRRARGINVYATLRSLGRTGISALIERCCDHASHFAKLLAQDTRIQILNDVVLNQVLVRFGDSDALTEAVIKRVQDDGICWLGGTKWQGKSAMRISVSNWSTTHKDVEISVEAIVSALDRLV